MITVCYNSEEFIENAINSVLSQTYKNKEYIIIDGDSKDTTVSIINKYKDKIHYFLSEPDKGIYDAMNKGISVASGDILYFLNSDDNFYDNYVIENITKIFKKNIKVEIIYGNIIIYNPKTRESFIKTHENVTKMFFKNSVICQQGIFFKKEAFIKCGFFDDSYRITGDHEWELRAFYKYDLMRKYYPIVIAVYRDGGMSCPEKSLELANKERKKIIREYFTKFEIYNYMFLMLIKKISRKLEF